ASVWPSSRRLRPCPFSPIQPRTLGRPGATSCTSMSKPSLASQRSTCTATAASVAPGWPGRITLGMRTRSRVSSISSASSTWERTAARDGRRPSTAGGLLVGEREDDGVETDDAVLFARDVEVMALDFLGALLEGDDGLEARHVPERVGTLVE